MRLVTFRFSVNNFSKEYVSPLRLHFVVLQTKKKGKKYLTSQTRTCIKGTHCLSILADLAGMNQERHLSSVITPTIHSYPWPLRFIITSPMFFYLAELILCIKRGRAWIREIEKSSSRPPNSALPCFINEPQKPLW